MDVPSLIAHALDAVDGNQAELARRLGRSETTVSRWVAGRNGIDYESALRLAKLTGLPPHTVVEAVGLDPSLLPAGNPRDGRVELVQLKRVITEMKKMLEPFTDPSRAEFLAIA